MSTAGRFDMKWVHQNLLKDKRGTVISESGQRPSLCFKGRKHMICVIGGHPVRIIKRPVDQYNSLREVSIQQPGPAETGKGHIAQTIYPIEDAVTQFRALGEKNGITQGASNLLTKALAWALAQGKGEAGIDEDEFNDEENASVSDETPETTTPEESGKETTVSKKTSKKAGKAKAAKKAKAPKAPKGPSRISRAVAYMKEEVKKEGGQRKLERGFRKELFERTAKKFDLSPATCSIQYNKQVLNG